MRPSYREAERAPWSRPCSRARGRRRGTARAGRELPRRFAALQSAAESRPASLARTVRAARRAQRAQRPRGGGRVRERTRNLREVSGVRTRTLPAGLVLVLLRFLWCLSRFG